MNQYHSHNTPLFSIFFQFYSLLNKAKTMALPHIFDRNSAIEKINKLLFSYININENY